MQLPVTAATAAALAVLLLLLAIDTVRQRFRLRVAHGTAEDAKLTSASRSHGNLAEHAPIVLIMIGLLEYSGVSTAALEVIAATFVVGRLAHAHGLYHPKADGPPLTRSIGVILTWLVMIALVAWILMLLVKQTS